VVTATKVDYQEWQPHMKAVGSLRAVQGVDVSSEVDGLVHKIHFTPGANVKEGDLLVELTSDADVAQLHALEAQSELAQTVYNRDKAQFDIKAISKATLDSDAANLKNFQAQVASQAATVAKKNITAPFTGRLGVAAVNPGQYLNAGDKIVTLQALDPIYADFSLPQQALAKVAVDQSVTLHSDTYPDETFTGKITTIDPKVDSATRNVQVEATLTNAKQLLLPGMFATVLIDTGKAERYLTLPQTAITYNPYGDLVYIISADDKDKSKLAVKQSFVTLGETRGNQVAVLKGLAAGDQVVTSGGLKLQNGSQVVINNKVEPNDEAEPEVEEE
jgi:membrane fusion protein (multidrug efflux system)